MSVQGFVPTYPLRIVTGKVMASLDRQTIEARGIPGLWLMERAGEGVVSFLQNTYDSTRLRHACIFCGKGNNGGDGLVVARRLADLGLQPEVILIGSAEELQGDARTNFLMAQERGIGVHACRSVEDLDAALSSSKFQLFVDALLGTGAKGAPKGLLADAIHRLNYFGTDKSVVSVDIPSGVEADTGKVEGEAVRADAVCTFGLPKVGLMVPPGLNYYRRLEILDIGFPQDLLAQADSEAEWITVEQVNSRLPHREMNAHKGSEGHLLILAGSRGMTGAALLCARAAISLGSGLVTGVCPQSLLPIYAGGVWEMLTLPVEETPDGSIADTSYEAIFNSEKKYSAVVVGPGLGRNSRTMDLVRRIVQEVPIPVLVDGDGLFAVTPQMLAERKAPWVVTPHPGEMARWFDVSAAEVQADRWNYAKRAAVSSLGAVVLKGAKTVTACQGNPLYINSTGSPAMASGGMGDTLAGMIGSLLAKGLSPPAAAVSGVFLHGLAADLAVAAVQAEAVSATEVSSRIPQAVAWVRNRARNMMGRIS